MWLFVIGRVLSDILKACVAVTFNQGWDEGTTVL
jgi:hypothetical protein